MCIKYVYIYTHGMSHPIPKPQDALFAKKRQFRCLDGSLDTSKTKLQVFVGLECAGYMMAGSQNRGTKTKG